ncbi:myb/SANT-like DNA-binding domain-containing protein 2 [Chrysemys picta bellii]|uniref:myb/SANT-like DNA-binding domain-containing protein 2 n=1 Tax=Chrysemys picta bellii TaxID=8478 RepID=UPI0032B145CE
MRNRKRAPAWTDREVLDLIAVWGDESVLSELRSKRRNAKIYETISKAMTETGYSRDATQCRVKIKELRQGYQKTKEANGRSGSQPQTCRFYEALHSILGAATTTTPALTVDSEDGILSTPASSEMLADGEDEEGDEEDEAVDSAYNADFPDSQDLFICLTEIPYQPSPGVNPDPESGEGSVAVTVSRPTLASHSQRLERKGHGTTCSQNLWAAPEPRQPSRPSGGRTCRNTSEHTANGRRGGGRKTSRRLKRCLD